MNMVSKDSMSLLQLINFVVSFDKIKKIYLIIRILTDTCALSERELLKLLGVHPSGVPTVLPKPAEKPPVKAPWNLRLP